jgi:hypothetical protein
VDPRRSACLALDTRNHPVKVSVCYPQRRKFQMSELQEALRPHAPVMSGVRGTTAAPVDLGQIDVDLAGERAVRRRQA